MKKIRLIVTDLDNTLLRRDKTISDYTIDVFKRAHTCGIQYAFATGRSYESSQEFRDIMHPEGDIVTGGCLVFASGQLLQSFFLPEPESAVLLAELCRYSSIKRVSARSLNTAYSNLREENRIRIDFTQPLPEKFIHCSCNTDDNLLMKSIAVRYPMFSILHMSESDLYDINPKDATKLNGIKTLSEHFKIPYF